MLKFVVVAVLFVLHIWAAWSLAKSRGKDPALWGTISCLVPVVSLVLLWLSPAQAVAVDSATLRCPKCRSYAIEPSTGGTTICRDCGHQWR